MYRAKGGPAEVKVMRKPYTPRDRLLGDKFNVTVRLGAQVPQNSYLFVWRGELKEVSLLPIKNEVKDFLERGQVLQRFNYIASRVTEYVKIKAPTKIKEPPTIRGAPYIPASSIKGMARSRLEYKFFPKLVGDKLVSYACYAVQDGEVSERHKQFWGDVATYRREGPCAVEGEEDSDVCIVCDIFGAPSLASRVDFSDATLTRGGLEALTDISIRAFKPGSSFNLICHGRNFNDAELGLLYLSFELFSGSPVLVGFKKYAHNPKVGQPYRKAFYFGLLQFNLEEVTILTHDFTSQSISPAQSIKRAQVALERSEYHAYLDYEKGVMRL